LAKPNNIMVVDDSRIAQKKLSLLLRNEGFNVIQASSGEEALARIKEECPDLVLLDIDMPGMNGVQVLNALKSDANFRALPVIMVTGVTDAETRVMALEQGADDFILKPFDAQELIFRINRSINIAETIKKADQDGRKHLKRLEESENKFRYLYEYAPLAYQSLDKEGNILEVNKEWTRLLGYSKEEVVGKNFADFLTPSSKELYRRDFFKLPRKGRLPSMEREMVRKDGAVITTSVDCSINGGNDNGALKTHCILHDITDKKRTEEALKSSEAKLSAILDNAPVAMLLIDRQRRVVTVNGYVEKMAGAPSRELIGLRGGEAVRCVYAWEDGRGCGFGPSCDSCTVRKAVTETFRTGESYRRLETVLTLSGDRGPEERNILMSTDLLEVSGDRLLLVCFEDVTGLKKTEHELRRSKEYLDRVLNGMFDALMVVDEEHRIMEVNNRFLRQYGVSREEAVGSHCYEVTKRLSRPCPNYDMSCPKQAVFEEGRPEMIEHVNVNGQGDLISVELSAFPILGPDGKVEAMTEMARDITEKKEAQRILEREQAEARRLKNFLESVMDNMMTGLLVTDVYGKVMIVNKSAREILDLGDQEVVGMPLETIWVGLEVFMDVENSPAGREIELNIGPDEKRPLGFTSTYLYKDGDEIEGVITVFRDMTEINQYRRKLKESEKLATIGEIAGGIAHEIKNPIFAISSGVQLLDSELDLPEEQKDTLDIIYKEVMRVDRLVKELLDFSRRRELKFADVYLDKLVNEVVSLNQGLVRDKNIGLELSCPENVSAPGDKDKLVQVIINILQNAIEASGQGDIIRIACGIGKTGTHAFLKIEDQGDGIPPEHINHIFDPFFSTKKGSTGTGLAVSKKIVSEHGGEIRVMSEAGKGTSFIIELPFRENHEK